jgi:hypothetical protein
MSRRSKHQVDSVPHEVVRYKMTNGEEVIRRYYQDSMHMPGRYREWIGSGEVWPDEFVDWWLNFIRREIPRVEQQKAGRVVEEFDLVTGEE